MFSNISVSPTIKANFCHKGRLILEESNHLRLQPCVKSHKVYAIKGLGTKAWPWNLNISLVRQLVRALTSWLSTFTWNLEQLVKAKTWQPVAPVIIKLSGLETCDSREARSPRRIVPPCHPHPRERCESLSTQSSRLGHLVAEVAEVKLNLNLLTQHNVLNKCSTGSCSNSSMTAKGRASTFPSCRACSETWKSGTAVLSFGLSFSASNGEVQADGKLMDL